MIDDPQPSSDPLAGLSPKALLARGLKDESMGHSAGDWSPPSPETLGLLIEGYEVKELIGRGGMGAVYRVIQKDLDRPSALKLLPLEISLKPGFEERFLQEARAMARLSHPNIVTIYDFGRSSEGHLYSVMEYVEGMDLAALLKMGKVEVTTALNIVSQVCEALEYAHSQGYVHRDIKPANILVDARGRIKVTDFGLAKIVNREQADHSMTMTGQVIGTPDYIAPEQARGEEVDHRADIYALGVMLYELLTGSLPKGIFPLPSQTATMDTRLDEVVVKAMQQEPERRYQQVSEVKSSIHEVSETEASPTPSRHPAEQLSKARKKQRRLSLGFGLAIFGVAVLLILGVSKKGQPEQSKPANTNVTTEQETSKAPPAQEPPVNLPPENATNGEKLPEGVYRFGDNHYQVISQPISWREAFEWCEDQGGHLATITSKAENEFCKQLIRQTTTPEKYGVYLLGALGSQNEEDWKWIDGEPVSYNDWDAKHRDRFGAVAHYLCIAREPDGALVWNATLDQPDEFRRGFIIEWEAGSTMFATRKPHDEAAEYPPKPRRTRGVFSDRTYEVVESRLGWREARAWCEEKGGHLVTIHSEAEDEFCRELLGKHAQKRPSWPYDIYFIGASKIPPAQEWTWVTDEPMNFERWTPGEPNNKTGDEHAAGFEVFRRQVNQWNDVPNDYEGRRGFIIEWDSKPAEK